MSNTNALVLSGGGLAGIAWHLGMIEALRAGGVDLTTADLVVGTSAGSVVGAQITTGQLEAAVAQQQRPATSEIYVDIDLQSFMAKIAELSSGTTDETEIMKRFGAYALETETVSEAARLAAVASRVPVTTWPQRPLKIVAVGATTGELVVFDRSSGVPLVAAIAASCAVPGVWPPTTIGDQRYIDGGIRSFTNADLAAGHARVLILLPVPPNPLHETRLAKELAVLKAATPTVKTSLLQVDAAAIAAIGPNPLDPARRGPALEAGRRQGRALVDTVRAFWDGADHV
ncbi:MAG TPA: patatin-like phospholipase family protein [Kofleriaceae bacterium]|nr:patatin-like phospholipase family protein [Kofleriaceae bacterium]